MFLLIIPHLDSKIIIYLLSEGPRISQNSGNGFGIEFLSNPTL